MFVVVADERCCAGRGARSRAKKAVHTARRRDRDITCQAPSGPIREAQMMRLRVEHACHPTTNYRDHRSHSNIFQDRGCMFTNSDASTYILRAPPRLKPAGAGAWRQARENQQDGKRQDQRTQRRPQQTSSCSCCFLTPGRLIPRRANYFGGWQAREHSDSRQSRPPSAPPASRPL